MKGGQLRRLIEAVRLSNGNYARMKDEPILRHIHSCCLPAHTTCRAIFLIRREVDRTTVLMAVMQTAKAIAEVRQDHGLCLEAVRIRPEAIRYVDRQTEAMCLEAVRLNPEMLHYVRNQTERICLEAVARKGHLLAYVRKRTNRTCAAAYLNDRVALVHVENSRWTEIRRLAEEMAAEKRRGR